MPRADIRSADLFSETFTGSPTRAVRSPGRVNLLGDHTDYNEGFVLPIAIDRDTHITFRARTDRAIHLTSEHGGSVVVELDQLEHGDPAWAEYVRGVAWALGSGAGHGGSGWDGAVATDVPIGAGLSSSASFEVAVGLVLDHVAGVERTPTEMAVIAQRAENDWVGMECGIMDQLSVAAARRGHAMLLDCRDLSMDHIPVPDDVAFVVLDTGTRRQLTESAYNERRATCEQAAASLGVPSLRSISIDDLSGALATLDEVPGRRVRHVVTENRRVLAAADALRSNDLQALGSIMTESHVSLRDDFESSTPSLDTMVEIANTTTGCFGARVTGAGFGGAAVAAVDRSRVEPFVSEVLGRYREATRLEPRAHVCIPSDGARVVEGTSVS